MQAGDQLLSVVLLLAGQVRAPDEQGTGWPCRMKKQNLCVRPQQGRQSLDSGFVRVSPGTWIQSPTVGLCDLVPDSHWGSEQQESEEQQVLQAWLCCLAPWNTCAGESKGLGTTATLYDSSHTWSEKSNI